MKFFLGHLRGMTTFILGEISSIPIIRRYMANRYVVAGYVQEVSS